MLSRHLDGGVGGTPDKDRYAFAAIGFYLRETVLDLIVFAGIAEGLFAAPFGPHHIEEFGGAGVAFVLVVDGVSVLLQLGGVAAGDDMEGDAATGELIDGRQLPGQQGRRGEAGPLCD